MDQYCSIMDANGRNDSSKQDSPGNISSPLPDVAQTPTSAEPGPDEVRMLTNAEMGFLHWNGRKIPINIFKRDGSVFAVPARPQSAAIPPPTAPVAAPPLSAASADASTPAPPEAASWQPLPTPAQPPAVRWAPAPRDGQQPAAQPAAQPAQPAPPLPPDANPPEDPGSWARPICMGTGCTAILDPTGRIAKRNADRGYQPQKFCPKHNATARAAGAAADSRTAAASPPAERTRAQVREAAAAKAAAAAADRPNTRANAAAAAAAAAAGPRAFCARRAAHRSAAAAAPNDADPTPEQLPADRSCALGAKHLDNDKTLHAALKQEREASAKAAAARKAWRAMHAALKKERESLGKADAAGAPATVAMAGAADRLPPEEAKLRTKEAKLHRRQIVVDKKRATERDASEGAPFVGGDAVVRRHIDNGLDGFCAVRAGTPGLVLCVLDDGDIEVLFAPAGRPKEVYTVDADHLAHSDDKCYGSGYRGGYCGGSGDKSGDSGETDDDDGGSGDNRGNSGDDDLENGADDDDLEEHRAYCERERVKRAEFQDSPQRRDALKATLMRDELKRRYAWRPGFDVAMRNAITVREGFERVNGRHYNNIQRVTEHDRFLDCWYHHWPDDDNGEPMTFEFWLDTTNFTAHG